MTSGAAGAPGGPGAQLRPDEDPGLTLVLVRHGETPMTALGAYSGSGVPGPGLTATGRIQAARAGDLVHRVGRAVWPDLRHPSTVLASPMVRTQETAAAIGRRLGLTVVTVPDLAEADFGAWEGLTAPQIEQRWPGELERWHHEPSVRPPGGESLDDVGARAARVTEEVLRHGVDRTVVVVSHAVTLRALLGQCLGTPASAWSRLRIAAGSVSVVRLWADGDREVLVAGMLTDR